MPGINLLHFIRQTDRKLSLLILPLRVTHRVASDMLPK